MDFSTITQTPEIRQLVQEGSLERAFHDALFPALLFRGEAAPKVWPANVGDTQIFTGAGLIKPKLKALRPGTDPQPSNYTAEQWSATLQQYADSIDTSMPTSVVAIANLFLRNAQQLGLSAGQSLNRMVRDRAYNAALGGHTVVDGAVNSVTVRVKRLAGFTTARRPDLAGGSPVRFDTVSGSNPLPIMIVIAGVPTARNVTGFTPDVAGDEIGPGTITLDVAANVIDRAAVNANDAAYISRVGGGLSIDALGNTDLLTLAAFRDAVSRFRQQNVPAQPDGRYHCHLDPMSEGQVFGDQEFQRLLTSLPDYYVYRDYAIGELLGTVFFRNSECPLPDTVDGGATAVYSDEDPFGAEVWTLGSTVTGIKVHRPLFFGQGGLIEYYQELSQLITEAGVQGKVGEPSITNNGIEVYADRIQLIIRAPQNRLQDQVATSWKFIGDWPVRTDVAVGDGARYKRVLAIEHGE